MHGSEPFWTALWELLGDGPHWAFEVITDIIFDVLLLGLALPLIKRWIRNHDEKHHHGHTSTDDDSEHGLSPLGPPISGMEWRGLTTKTPIDIDAYEPYWVRINEDGTFAIGRDRQG